MTIVGRPVSGGFDDVARQFITDNAAAVDHVYLHATTDIPTIGFGYALILSRDVTTNGVTKTQYYVNPFLQKDFAGIHKFSSSELNLLTKMASDLTANNLAAAAAAYKAKGSNLTFQIDDSDASSIFESTLQRDITNAGLGPTAAGPLANSYELVALEDLAYDSPALVKAILPVVSAGNRLAAWYDFLTKLNGGPTEGKAIETRRIAEAGEFGLYSQGNAPSSSDGGKEAISVFRFLDSKSTALTTYLISRGETAAFAKSFLKQSYAPAVSTLETLFGAGLSFANVVVSKDDGADTLALTDSELGPVLVVTGLGNDTISDHTTKGANNLIVIRGAGDTLQGGSTGDLADLVDFGGESLSENITFASGQAVDSAGRHFKLNSKTHQLTITLTNDDVLSITNFKNGDFGLVYQQTLSAPITFSEFAVGTVIKNQYKSRGIEFGGSGAFITTDISNPTSPVLSGTPQFTGAITGKFVDPKTGAAATVRAFSLDAGYFDALGSVRLTWYDASGKVLGSELDSKIGIEHFVVSASTSSIASWRIAAVGSEPNGFAIDNVEFGATTKISQAASSSPTTLFSQSVASFGAQASGGRSQADVSGRTTNGAQFEYGIAHSADPARRP